MSEQLPLGKLVTDERYHAGYRDAVHVAVVPVMAGEWVRSGDRVRRGRDGRYIGADTGGDGVVDPFLPDIVEAGQRFWLFLFPGTIRSLRHHWQHDAFPEAVPAATPSRDVSPERFVDRVNNLPTRMSYPASNEDREAYYDAITANAHAEQRHQSFAVMDEQYRARDFAFAHPGYGQQNHRTEAVVGLCRGILGGQTGTLPVLADALEDAGMTHEAILAVCRSPHTTAFEGRLLACRLLGDAYGNAAEAIDTIAARLDLTANALMECADLWETQEEYTTQMGDEQWRDYFDSETATRFWTAWRVVTGRIPRDDTAQFFSCSC